MGYLQDKQKKAQQMLDYCNYELSQEVTDRKNLMQAKIADLIENDTYEGVLDISEECIKLEVEAYDDFIDSAEVAYVNIINVASNDGEVYVTDADENEYFIDDIDETTFSQIYNAVIELTA